MTRIRGAVRGRLTLALVLIALSSRSTGANHEGSPPSPPPFARCEAESRSSFGELPISSPEQLKGMKRTKGRLPKYPDLPKGTRGRGTSIHELLIRPDGKVQRVWSLREPLFEPPFPAFGRAIADALGEWEYEPLVVDGRAVPACITVTTTIHWR